MKHGDATSLVTVSGAGYDIDVSAYTNVYTPRGHGQYRSAVSNPFTRYYPSRDWSMQFCHFVNASAGLYIQTMDATPGQTVWTLTSGGVLQIRPRGTIPDILVLYMDTDWRSSCKQYRTWALQQSWAAGTKTGMSDHRVFYTSVNPSLATEATASPAFTNNFGGTTGCWITNWRSDAFDVDYPDYTPNSLPDLKSLLQALKTAGCNGYPYMNGLLFDQNYSDSALLTAVALLDSGLNRVPYNTQTLPNLFYACPYSATWQSTLTAARDALVDNDGVKSAGIYLDVLAGANPLVCYATTHGHAAGDTDSWVTGIKAIINAMAGNVIIEANAEPYLNIVEGMLMHLYTDASSVDAVVPMWNSVYGAWQRSVGQYVSSPVTSAFMDTAVNGARSRGSMSLGSPWMTHLPQVFLSDSANANQLTDYVAKSKRVLSLPDHYMNGAICFWGDVMVSDMTTNIPNTMATGFTGNGVYQGGASGENSASVKARFDKAPGFKNRTHVFWVGHTWNSNAQTKADLAAMVAALGHTRYLILGTVNNGNTAAERGSGGARYLEIVQLNTDLAALYGSNFYDIRAAMVADGVLNADSQSTSYDAPPSYWQPSSVSLNAAGSTFAAGLIWAKLKALGHLGDGAFRAQIAASGGRIVA